MSANHETELAVAGVTMAQAGKRAGQVGRSEENKCGWNHG
jgi:hypothetical protein